MHINMSLGDGAIRIIIASIIAAVCGAYGLWIGVLAIVPLITGLSGWCPLYHIMGWSTSESSEASDHNVH